MNKFKDIKDSFFGIVTAFYVILSFDVFCLSWQNIIDINLNGLVYPMYLWLITYLLLFNQFYPVENSIRPKRKLISLNLIIFFVGFLIGIFVNNGIFSFWLFRFLFRHLFSWWTIGSLFIYLIQKRKAWQQHSELHCRDSKFEAVRIVAILMIILSHFSLYAQSWRLKSSLSVFGLIGTKIFLPFGAIGVALFVLITSYFESGRNYSYQKSISKFIRIWVETVFYTSTIFFLYLVFDRSQIGLKVLLKSFFPFSTAEYWFVTAFMMLVLLLPFINAMIANISQKKFIILILISLFFCDVLPIIRTTTASSTVGLGEIITTYLLGAFIKKYDFKIKKILAILVCLFSLVLIYLSEVGISLFLGQQHGGNITSGILPLFVAVSIFLLVRDLKARKSLFINFVASTVFAAYLITENELVREFLWHSLALKKISNVWMADLLGGILIFFGIFVFVFVVDIIRQSIFKYTRLDDLIDDLVKFISGKSQQVLNWFLGATHLT
ncbi:acyltransferase family protein [Oenococcus sicerae]|nr:acyltransferase family protein [Oenococcus sicerae]